jgi:protein-S-isoprenylcysteine O-methyltransferase Ste14
MQTFIFLFTLFCWVYWLIFYWGGGRLLARDVKHAAAANSRLEAVPLLAILALVLILFGTGALISFGWVTPSGASAPLWLRGIGALLTFGGMVGTFSCRHYLGKFWAADATLQANHQVVDTGPYRLVRHPIYTMALMMYLGTTLVFPVWWNGLAFVGLLVMHLLKTWSEDRFLRAELTGYAEYQTRVRFRLIPGVW